MQGLSDELKKAVDAAAKDTKGAAPCRWGSNDVNVQILVNAINEAIGSTGNTINWSVTNNSKAGVDADFAKLVDDMNAGSVETLVIIGSNPAYTWYDADKVKNGLKKVKTTVSFNAKHDETAILCKYVVPDHHFPESWGDAEARSGYFSLMQPTIYLNSSKHASGRTVYSNGADLLLIL